MTLSLVPHLVAAASVAMMAQTAPGSTNIPMKALPPQTSAPQAQIKRLPAFLPVNQSVRPMVLTGLRDASAVFSPLSVALKPMTLTGLLDAGASFQPSAVQLKPFAMTGLGGQSAAFAPVALTVKPFTLTGLRP